MRLRVLNSKTKIVEPVKPKTTKVIAANSKEPSKAQDKFEFSPRVLCKGSHALWNCAVFKEKNATQRAKYVAEKKLCFASSMAIIVFGNVVELRNAHIMSCSMEPRKYFLEKKI